MRQSVFRTILATLLASLCGQLLITGVAQARERQLPSSALSLNPPQLYQNQLVAGFSYADESGMIDKDASQGEADQNQAQTPKSPFVAVGLSLALPGAGQLYAKNPGQARVFFGIEAATWIGYAGLRLFAEWKEDDVLRFAQRHAGITPGERDEEFLRLLTFYEDRERYNTLGRAFDPEDPFLANDPALDWSWDSPENQDVFRGLFNDKRSADRNAEFMFIAAAANRLVSAALAWRETKRHNARIRHDDEFGARPKTESVPQPLATISFSSPGPTHVGAGGLLVTFSRKF